MSVQVELHKIIDASKDPDFRAHLFHGPIEMPAAPTLGLTIFDAPGIACRVEWLKYDVGRKLYIVDETRQYLRLWHFADEVNRDLEGGWQMIEGRLPAEGEIRAAIAAGDDEEP